jgi:hypothetical protein
MSIGNPSFLLRRRCSSVSMRYLTLFLFFCHICSSFIRAGLTENEMKAILP